MAMVKKFDIIWVNLDPSIGSEIQKIRPALVISPDEMNKYLSTVIISPITSSIRDYPSRVFCNVKNKQGQIAIDQIKAIDKSRISGYIDVLDKKTQVLVIDCLLQIFSN